MDALDDSHGFTFTYLPVVFQDDCQMCDLASRFVKSDRSWYEVLFTFLDPSVPRPASRAVAWLRGATARDQAGPG